MLTAEGKKIGPATSNLCRVPSYTERDNNGKLATPTPSIQSYPPHALILCNFLPLGAYSVNHLIPKYQDLNSPNLAQREYMGSVGRIGSLIPEKDHLPTSPYCRIQVPKRKQGVVIYQRFLCM